MKILCMSGYAPDIGGSAGLLDSAIACLPKPFQPGLLATKVRQMLDAV
jgi:hypothetical protein